MNSLKFTAFFLTGVFYKTASEDEFKNCPNMTPVENFDFSRFKRGVWVLRYYTSKDNIEVLKDFKCAVVHFDAKDPVVLFTNITTNTEVPWYFQVKEISKGVVLLHKFNVEYGWKNDKLIFVETDYDSLGIVLNCAHRSDGSLGFIGLIIYSRKRDDPIDLEKIKQQYKKELNHDMKFIEAVQTNCPPLE